MARQKAKILRRRRNVGNMVAIHLSKLMSKTILCYFYIQMMQSGFQSASAI